MSNIQKNLREQKKMLLYVFFLGLGFCGSLTARDTKISEVDGKKVFFRSYKSTEINDDPVLVLVLHGDSPFKNPSYQYAMAKKIAAENKNTIAIGVLRPGYVDNEGNRSQGNRGNATGDNYTKPVLRSIHRLAMDLKKRYGPSKIILVGHSGGAAITGNLIARYPGFYNDALLLSCPCDVGAWRKHMGKLQPDTPLWDYSVKSVSPIEGVSEIATDTELILLHGTKDNIVPMAIADAYLERLKQNDKKARLIKLPGYGHEIAFTPKVFEWVRELIQE